MFKIEKHVIFFKRILKANERSGERLCDILMHASVKDLYATLLVIKSVLKGEIPMPRAEYNKLISNKKLFRLARQTW